MMFNAHYDIQRTCGTAKLPGDGLVLLRSVGRPLCAPRLLQHCNVQGRKIVPQAPKRQSVGEVARTPRMQILRTAVCLPTVDRIRLFVNGYE